MSKPVKTPAAYEEDDDDGPTWSLARILALAGPEWKALTVGTFFLLLGAAMGLAYPQAVRVIINNALEAKDEAMVDKAAVAMAVIFGIQGIAMAFRSYLFTVAGERIVTNLRADLYRAVVAQDIAFFDARRTGELMNRLASDTTVLQNTVSVNVSMALRHVAATIGGIALLFFTSAELTALMLLIVPAVVVAALYFGRHIRRLSKKVQDALADASDVAEETLAGIRTVRSFTREPEESERYGEAVERSFELAKTRSALGAVFFGATTFAGYGAIAVVLWWGGHLVIEETMNVGDLTQFVLYTLIVAFSIGALGGLWADFMKASGAAQRVFALLDRKPTMALGEGDRPKTVTGRIEFEDVVFRYPTRPDVVVLEHVNLALEPGQIVALVGPSGGGKSTIAALISRFYDPNSGAVKLDGRNVVDLDPEWLRKQIGMVSQEPVLFSTSIVENILYGRPDATIEDVHEAARDAYASDFIESFPDGYDTLVGERGVQLSGGQKQRVAIARALLKDPGVLVLDEATSALDAESEALVKDALDRLMEGRTTLVIAHRLSTVRDADKVVVVDQGRIVESGTHHELLELDGMYRRLVQQQFEAAPDDSATREPDEEGDAEARKQTAVEHPGEQPSLLSTGTD